MTLNTFLSSIYTIVVVINVFATDVAGDASTLENSDAGKDHFTRLARQGNFVRIGRGSSGFVRIGKMDPEHEVNDLDLDELTAKDKTPQFLRSSRYPHMNRFIRIGRRYFDADRDDDWFSSKSKRPSSFVRIGKDGKDDDYDKRASGFVRIGKSFPLDDYDKRASGFVRIGKSYYSNDFDKKASGFVRIGKRPGFVRIGKDFEEPESDFIGGDEDSKRASGFVRIGKSQKSSDDLDNEVANDKRASSFVRIGKSLLNYDNENIGEQDKRASGFVRIGKPHTQNLFQKRLPGFVRIGKSHFLDNGDDLSRSLFSIKRTVRSTFNDGFDKEAAAKRAAGFVRIGKSNAEDELDKRTSHFVRIGKDLINAAQQHANQQKKSSGFVRIGKSSSPSSHGASGEWAEDVGQFNSKRPINVSRRGSAFVRIGKIPSSAFVPLGKDIERLLDVPAGGKVGYRRRSRNGQSSFVRIG